ncbi:Cytochrome P450 monooxygenase sdnE [Fulvia fulva]|uniref:Cytochrome P450 monooxygenase sdnE n=1 Tax=Passalora fulva TaxID=5499 RepID=A0A9Q8LAE1_PASFU|nr:Cytochrome P450 monooxygenase sdnE [Fulvia fulva]KAK4631699.1 Cytochrome P450 monooxygenase sdnE [Fulvia fulva]KAK4632515.1 Cytochrome P450 monooxygenase sdnE [Fulvia fulva]UJO13750.1 Cytochrome P450 monooxygenase sdnE [Fulvia fulva]WPV10745.1 Cytochrome P450 monooxygenase sdnE [Fulvia fulva]WPV26619.1 Cytochrome P450 monooxygenase sdnE [Fulvia fulva]
MATFSIVLAGIAAFLAYVVGLAIYRLYFHPLAEFPGPKLAALTKWYEAYYEIVLNGKFSFHIEDLHRQYGPIIRITPFEIHIQDPPFWETLYAKHPKSSKYAWTSGRFGNSNSVFTTSSPTLHKTRRAPLNNMFSRRAILTFEPEVQKKLDIFCNGLRRFKKTGSVCKISEAFSAFAGDVVTQYSFGFDYDHLGLEGFTDSFHDAFMAVSGFGHVALQFPWMHGLLNSLPDEWNKAMNPPLAKLLDLQKDLRAKIAGVRRAVEENEKLPEHPTVFHTLLQSETLPEQEKSDLRLAEEAQLILGAGIETTAWALCQATYYILANPMILHNLKTELRQAVPDVTKADAFRYDNHIESLPYLRGCIKEAIRLSLSVSGRNPRVLNEPLVWRDWVIPPGTPISMTIADVHLNDDYFSEAGKFKPERWIGEAPTAPDGSPLERYFVAFGKGPRQCLGINLAYMELYLMLGRLFRQFDLELYQTDESDVLLAHDWFLPSPKLDSKGIRVKVVGIEV